jgi:ferredoxin-NADP reductase
LTQSILEHDADPMRLQVRSVVTEADEVIAVTLVRADGGPLPDWEPGAHLEITLASGLIRHYSLCGNPSDRTSYRIAILRQADGRGGSIEAHASLVPGAEIQVRGPRNNFELHPGGKTVFVAGGVGITPILTQIRQAEQDGRDWRLYYGGRSRASMAFVEELSLINSDRVTLVPQDEKGLINLDQVLSEARDGDIYACGPTPLLEALEDRCSGGRVPLYLERFAATRTETSQHDEHGFTVELQRTGLELQVPPEKSILDVTLEAGIPFLWSCKEGICGTCVADVLEGEPDHRDDYLSDQEKADSKVMMICVSRCKGKRLVLDI